MLREFAGWIAATPLSRTFQDVLWIVPASQSLHIIALAVVFSSALMINLRLLGLGSGRSRRFNDGRGWRWLGFKQLARRRRRLWMQAHQPARKLAAVGRDDQHAGAAPFADASDLALQAVFTDGQVQRRRHRHGRVAGDEQAAFFKAPAGLPCNRESLVRDI